MRFQVALAVLGHEDDGVQDTGYSCRGNDGGPDDTIRSSEIVEQDCRRVAVGGHNRDIESTSGELVCFLESQGAPSKVHRLQVSGAS